MTDTPSSTAPAEGLPAGGTTAEPPADAPERSGGPKPLGVQAKIAVAVIAVAAVVTLLWPRGDGTFEAPGGFLLDAAGRPQTLGPRMAPVTLVHFWSTWCPPCRTETPAVHRLMDDYTRYPDFQVLMVAVDDEVDAVEEFLGGDAHHVLYDPTWDIAHRYDTRKLPESHLVVAGRVVESWRGTVDWDDPKVRRQIDAALAEAGVVAETPST
jgi:thiol-disulfide isomerase/thioredoxin